MMASSPCDCWTHLSDSLSPSSSSSSSSSSLLSQTSSSIEHVWSDDIILPSLSNSPVDLDLNNHSSFLNQHQKQHQHQHQRQPQLPSTLLTLTSTSTTTSTSTSVFHKHPLLSNSVSNTHHQDQKHMRAIRNRESAVRSRARKQAYRKGLEVEITRLTEENSRLRRRLKELQCCLSSSESDNPPRKGASCKTSSSPF